MQPLNHKYHLLICAHKKRDKRCGVMGPILADEFENEITLKKLQHEVHVLKTSHYGGHKFAGNVIIYPGGDWYGRVIPCHVPCILEEHIQKKKIVKNLWRGNMNEQ